MRINLSPQRRDDKLEVSVYGDIILINGVPFDFGPLPEGAKLPHGSVSSEWVSGEVSRIDGEISLTLILPHGPNPSRRCAFPDAIWVTAQGPVLLPFDPVEEAVEIDLGATPELMEATND